MPRLRFICSFSSNACVFVDCVFISSVKKKHFIKLCAFAIVISFYNII